MVEIQIACAKIVYPLQYYCFNLVWQGNVIATNFRTEAVIQQNVLHLQIISNYTRCNPRVQELDTPCDTDGDCHSLWPFQRLLFSPICHINLKGMLQFIENLLFVKREKVGDFAVGFYP